MSSNNPTKSMRKTRGRFASLHNDMRAATPFLVGGYWCLIILLIAYWALSPA